jgi:hypothetical protein
MIKKIIFGALICISFADCKPDSEALDPSNIPSNLRYEEAQMIGVWQEFGNIAYQLDSLGNRIDSVNLNSTYEFKSDFTYTSVNDITTKSAGGTWKVDSNIINNIRIRLYPKYPNPNYYREDIWNVVKLEEPNLRVDHTYELILFNDSYHILKKRTFVRVE